jgi:hypothetical protein
MLASRRGAVVALVLLGLSASAVMSLRWCYEPDLWWHLAHGREIAAGTLPRANLFSFTHPDHAQPSTSWLFDLGIYALWRVGGAAGVQLGQLALIFATLALLFAACRQRSGVAASLAVVTVGFFVLEPRALPRPHTVSFAGMAACAYLIERAEARRSARPLLAAVPLLLVWSNLHVESIFGLAFLGCFALDAGLWGEDEQGGLGWRPLGVVLACMVAMLVNPYGLGLVRYLVENARVPEVIRIAELQPPYLPSYGPFFVYLIAAVGLLLVPPRPRMWEVLATVLFAALSIRYLRFTPLLVCATAPMVAERLVSTVGNSRLLPLGALFVGALTARATPSTLASQLGAGIEWLAPAEIIPHGGVDFARRTGLAGPLFNSNNIGGYLIWELYPESRVFQDSRLQAYPADHFREIMAAYRSQERWNALVADVDWAMLSVPRPNELSGAGRFPQKEWARVYWDDASEIFVRRAGAFARLVPDYEYRVLGPDFDPFARLPLTIAAADRLLTEVLRNRIDNPASFAPAAWLCLHGDDEESCAAAEEIASRRPELRRVVLRLARLRGTPDRSG